MKKEYIGYLHLLNTLILFSTYEAVSKTLVGRINPFQINFIRFLIGGIILFVFLLLKENLSISKKDLIWVTVLGVINVVFSMCLLQLSLYVGGARASVSAIIFSSNPIFVSIFATYADKEKITPYRLAGLLLGLAGIIVIFFDKLDFSSNILNPLLALISAAFFGLYTVLGRKVAVRIGSLKMNSYSFLIGSAALLPILIFSKISPVDFDYSCIIQVAYISVLVTGLAYLTYFYGLSITGASKGSLIFFIKPILASVIAILFLKEPFSLNLLMGTVLIILGVLIVLYWTTFIQKISLIFKYQRSEEDDIK